MAPKGDRSLQGSLDQLLESLLGQKCDCHQISAYLWPVWTGQGDSNHSGESKNRCAPQVTGSIYSRQKSIMNEITLVGYTPIGTIGLLIWENISTKNLSANDSGLWSTCGGFRITFKVRHLRPKILKISRMQLVPKTPHSINVYKVCIQ